MLNKKINLDEYLPELDVQLIEKYAVTTGEYTEWAANGVRIFLRNIRVGVSFPLEIPLPISKAEVLKKIEEKINSEPELKVSFASGSS